MLTWWEKLGLSVRADRRDASETERKKVMARARMLERFRPVQFEADGERIDLDELTVRLEAAGMTPHDYRRAQEALGRPIFSEGQVSSGSCECGEV